MQYFCLQWGEDTPNKTRSVWFITPAVIIQDDPVASNVKTCQHKYVFDCTNYNIWWQQKQEINLVNEMNEFDHPNNICQGVKIIIHLIMPFYLATCYFQLDQNVFRSWI